MISRLYYSEIRGALYDSLLTRQTVLPGKTGRGLMIANKCSSTHTQLGNTLGSSVTDYCTTWKLAGSCFTNYCTTRTLVGSLFIDYCTTRKLVGDCSTHCKTRTLVGINICTVIRDCTTRENSSIALLSQGRYDSGAPWGL